ncbi:hypothetical protein EYF80_029633 [Liparis tanakae]|uniref:Uncharacterized protein n=1 Tax=Liparis tanakae TaxID=230148 RepID=A0A4Z2H581_9TELE|nr:hypothetical protein EYF80_029633 [Liparis tanakae]
MNNEQREGRFNHGNQNVNGGEGDGLRRDKKSEGRRDLLGIHLSLRINKGLLADRHGEGSATAELRELE